MDNDIYNIHFSIKKKTIQKLSQMNEEYEKDIEKLKEGRLQ